MRLNKDDIKKIPISSYLKAIEPGLSPIQRGNFLWYKSPLRQQEENKPSFQVDLTKNTFLDWGYTGERNSGDIITLHILYQKERCGRILKDFNQVLQEIHNITGGFVSQIVKPDYELTAKDPLYKKEKSKIVLCNEQEAGGIYAPQEIIHPVLINYIVNIRKLPLNLFKQYYKQIYYRSFENQEKPFYGLGILNDSGKYEIMSAGQGVKSFKSAESKNITTIEFEKQSGIIAVFESGTDFISFLKINTDHNLEAAYILHTTKMRKRFIEAIQARPRPVSEVLLYLDNDQDGQKTTELCLADLGDVAKDMRGIFKDKNLKDFNDLIIFLEKTPD